MRTMAPQVARWMRWAAAVCMGFAALLATTVVGCQQEAAGQPAPTPRPNIVFILVDTLRADRLGCYGYEGLYSTPVMDLIAEEGVLFERAIATSPWTLPSVPSMLTGTYPSVHKVINGRNMPPGTTRNLNMVRGLPEQFITLAELLQANGYATAGFSANPFVVAKNGFAQGFDHFDSTFAHSETPGSRVNQAALRWLDARDTSKPVFLYLHYMDVHAPYVARDKHILPLISHVEKTPDKRRVARMAKGMPRPSATYASKPWHRRLVGYVQYWEACYDAGVSQVDEYLGQLRDELTKRGIWDDAWIVLVADHGEALGEHQVLWRDGRFYEIWGHGDSNYQIELHVPLVLRWTGVLPSGGRVPGAVSLVDMLPTMLDYLDIEVPADVQGRSLRAMIRGEACEPVPVMAEGVKKRPEYQALVHGPWKLISYGKLGRWEMYNLDRDPDEQDNVAEQEAQRVADMRSVLQAMSNENIALAEGVRSREVTITPEEKARLQALGYLLDDESDESTTQPAGG